MGKWRPLGEWNRVKPSGKNLSGVKKNKARKQCYFFGY